MKAAATKVYLVQNLNISTYENMYRVLTAIKHGNRCICSIKLNALERSAILAFRASVSL